MILQTDAVLLKAMVDAAETAYPAEACGLIIGRGRGQLIRVTRVVPAANLLAATGDRFELDPAVRIQVEKELRDSGTKDRIVGHYHSHTDGSSDPSGADRASAHEPDMAWVIIGVLDGQAIHTQAHRIDERHGGGFRTVPIRIPKKSACAPSGLSA